MGLFKTYSQKEVKRILPIQKAVLDLETKYKAMFDADLRAQTDVLRGRLAKGETLDDILPDAFAVCREASDRVLYMRHFPVQIIGGIVLHQGRIAEMRTGEGKTLVATLAAYLNALSGDGVHVVTVNDYLAKRDAEWMGKIYRFLGLTVGCVVHGLDNEERRAAYACDITYGTNNELGFDYLRDNMVIYKEQRVGRGFSFAIVDEVDSILIDEARTPLIISGQGDKSTELYKVADNFAKTLKMIKVKELDDKEENEPEDGDYIVDEKARNATLTASGVAKAETFFGIENLMDADHITTLHHINQAIKANGVMKNEIDYVVKDGEVIIVDEFTGRLMLGRRYNEGLHQAIEAKEGVNVERESKTLATITFQNFFRLYKKLSGMTGTALTEESEFREIYKLDVIEIPTNKPVARNDLDDQIYKTEKGKYNAVIDQIVECHEKGQPVLVGTISIERSEMLAAMLKKRGVPHEVLNAKYHDKEAEIVAQAGKKGAVTIATNMAGRGTDIVLGGNPEYAAKTQMRKAGFSEELIAESTGHAETDDAELIEARKKFSELFEQYRAATKDEAKEVCDAGGLYILGTERHESRRIDNQLRGRAGRQGDPGESRFFLSLEDDLLRLFGGDRVQKVMTLLGFEEDQPIQTKMLTNTIENAQRKVEGRNFATRKSVLQFDDVMNRQREIIYGQRAKVLDGEDLKDYISKMMSDLAESAVEQYIGISDIRDEWNIEGLHAHFTGWILDEKDLTLSTDELDNLDKKDIVNLIKEKALEIYAAREQTLGSEIMRELERVVLLRMVDTKWMDHIDAMDELRRGIYMRAYAQRDPVVDYRIEGFDMFDQMIDSIREDTVRLVLTAQIKGHEEPKREQVAEPTSASVGGERVVKKSARTVNKIGRNDLCPCGSGKKYKKCCGSES